LERERQGRGNEFPLPVGPAPNGDIPTVHSMGRPRRRTWHGFPPAHPRHGCSPDIRPGTDPAPPGRGRSAAGAGGVRDAEEVSGYPCEGAGGMGEPRGDEEPPTEVYAEQPELNAWISPYGARAG